MADSEKREIASLDFDITKGIQQLEILANTLNKISQNTETQFKNMSNTIEKSINSITTDKIKKIDLSKVIDTTSYTKSLNNTVQLSEKANARILENFIKRNNEANLKVESSNKISQNRMTEVNNREIQKRITNEEDFNHKRELQAQKTADKLMLQEQKLTSSLNNSFLDKMKSYAQAFIGFQGLDALRQSAVDFVDTMKSVESRMSEISRIMEDGTIDVQNYRDEIIQLGYDYSRTFDEVSTVTLNFARAGYNAQESLAMTEKSLLALNTAELDANEATDGLISIMAQWGLNTGTATEKAQKLESIIDKINKTADNFPVSSEGLLQALQRTSQGFNLAGASIDETIALIVAAETAAQRGGKEIGTAMANIIQQLKAEGKLNLAEELGLDFYEDDAKTVFKSITDIFAEMSERMAQLKEEGKESSTEMQSLLELFTVFRRNIGAGLLSEMEGEDST